MHLQEAKQTTHCFAESPGATHSNLHCLPWHRAVHLFHGCGVSPGPGVMGSTTTSQKQEARTSLAALSPLERSLRRCPTSLGLHVVRPPRGIRHAGHGQWVVSDGSSFSHENRRHSTSAISRFVVGTSSLSVSSGSSFPFDSKRECVVVVAVAARSIDENAENTPRLAIYVRWK